jgi:hypothetical protein
MFITLSLTKSIAYKQTPLKTMQHQFIFTFLGIISQAKFSCNAAQVSVNLESGGRKVNEVSLKLEDCLTITVHFLRARAKSFDSSVLSIIFFVCKLIS